MVTCIKFNPELRYTQEQLLEHLPQITATVSEKSTSFYEDNSSSPILNKGLDRVLKNCDFIKYCRENAYDLREHDWYSMISNLAVFEGGSEEIHRISKPYPHYFFEETEEKIGHFIQSGTKPINCSTIAEKGYKCPKLLSGECSCKSPAALAFIPLSIDELGEILNKLEITNQKVKDIDTASKFISQHLCNVDELIALSFISYNIKEKFRFDINDIRLLKKKYKEANSAYLSSKKSAEANDEPLPLWYITNRNGITFLPGILARHLSETEHCFYVSNSFFRYENGVYKKIDDLQANRIVKSKLFDSSSSMSDITDCTGQWKMEIYKESDCLNNDPNIINLKNGLFDINEQKLIAHEPDYYSTVQIGASYNEEAECPRFMQFLNETLDPEDIQTVQEILGYLLIPVNKAQKSFLFVGPGHSGKSTLLSVIQDVLLGKENISNVPWQSLSDRFNKALLFNKLANVFADLPSAKIEDNGIFKSITGEDRIYAEEKGKTPFSFTPFARLVFSCNDIPKNYGDKSNAFYRRLVIIRFSKSIPQEKRDPHLKEHLRKEADGILMFALQGLFRLIDNNYIFTISQKSRDELEMYRKECNPILSFVEDECELSPSEEINAKDLYDAYTKYCEGSGLHSMSRISFSKSLRENFEQITNCQESVSRRVGYKGITLKIDDDDLPSFLKQ